jgi:hypothetical protein
MKDLKLPVSFVLAALLAAGCNGGPDATPSPGEEDSAAAGAAPPSPPPPTLAPDDASRRIVAPGAVFQLPDDWVPEPPESQMRLAQAQIPGPGGPGQLTVFHFGAGGGGGTEANLQRWITQMEADGEPFRDSFTLGTWKVSWVEVAGTLKPSTMGMGPTEPQAGSRLLGGVVEGEGGPWFFKATGPAETLEAQRDAFLELLKSGRTHP